MFNFIKQLSSIDAGSKDGGSDKSGYKVAEELNE